MSKRLVDKHLAIARELLLFQEGNVLQTQGLVSSIAVHVYFSLIHYLHELQTAYPYYPQTQRSKNEAEVPSLLICLENIHNSISEAEELKQLLKQKDSWLCLLINTIVSMSDDESAATNSQHLIPSKQIPPTHIPSTNIITSNSSNHTPQKIENIQGAKWLLDECYVLIQRQREHATEC